MHEMTGIESTGIGKMDTARHLTTHQGECK